ncbi:putative HD superfamily hydrolase of NAD metabolism [Lachnospiraceae bacterium NE2001]|nr:putative HD superfamily hydrolase of NAD metabolism [Lachnospiraceae bacterium NE2001]
MGKTEQTEKEKKIDKKNDKKADKKLDKKIEKKTDKKIEKKPLIKKPDLSKPRMERTEIVKKLETKLNPKRFVHTIGVEYTAANLAFVHGADVEKARLAGLLHDCAKYIPTDEKLKRAKKYGIKPSKFEKANPDLIHGKLGAYMAKDKYGVDDPEILSAITYHTTGHPDMSLLDKIIFVADYIEPNRKLIRDLPEIRREAYLDLDKCIVHILKNTLEYLKTTDAAIDELTQETYDFYVKKLTK